MPVIKARFILFAATWEPAGTATMSARAESSTVFLRGSVWRSARLAFPENFYLKWSDQRFFERFFVHGFIGRCGRGGLRSLAAAESAEDTNVQIAASFRRNKTSIGFRGAEGPDALQVIGDPPTTPLATGAKRLCRPAPSRTLD